MLGYTLLTSFLSVFFVGASPHQMEAADEKSNTLSQPEDDEG